MSGQRIGIGFVGCGRITDLQCLGYLGSEAAEIVAVCDMDGERARRRAAEWGARAWYDDLERLLGDPAVDAVEIATPHHLHAAHAIAALEAGKHVSLQKPPTLTLAELEAVGEAARRSGRTLRVLENFMYYPPHQKARQLVEEGAIGEPLSVRLKTSLGRLDDGWRIEPSTQAWRMRSETCGGGMATFDHGYHCYNMARFFMPVEVDRVHAFIHQVDLGEQGSIDVPALISWSYAGDVPRYGSWEVVASLGMRVRSKYYASDDRMEIHGSEGCLWVNRCTGRLLEEPPLVLYREGETRAYHDLASDWAESFRLGGRDFADALREGRQPAQTLAEARQTLAFALAAGRSAAEGREVRVGELLAEAAARAG